MPTSSTPDSVVVWETEELRVIRALQLSPRASFTHIGAVLGLSEQVVARRYRKLRRDGILRVFGAVNPAALGQHQWMVRAHCRPGGTEGLAAALAERRDVVWVALSAAGSEVLFSVRSLSAEQRDALLVRALPRAAQVLDIEAAVVLHSFAGMQADDWGALAGCLTEEEDARLDAGNAGLAGVGPVGGGAGLAGAARGEPVRLEPFDQAIFAALAHDGRASYAELAAAAGISEGRAARRLTTLLGTGTVIVDIDLAMPALGYSANAYLHLRVAPAQLHTTGQALGRMPEVGFAAAMSGPHNLVASVVCRDLAELYTFVTTRTGTLEGVQTLEVSPVLRNLKQAGAFVANGRLVDPARARRGEARSGAAAP